ncbi:hypothetical protein AAON49_08110 [Pseudotenacibaculum sp. MALMAid0570]|uniref:hypothetical protein n=1 Tax=Pseudotenacibaculum sp. MALMAid0570 TaxID=3143938 RepID=UPI0032DE5F7A
MKIHGIIATFPKELKLLILFFLIPLSIGFYSGISFVRTTTGANPTGIEQRYLGNEDDENATKMLFKKSEGEILTTIHSHLLSLSVIFFIVALIVATTSISKKIQLFLMIEPFISLLVTFGGIYFLWKGFTWVKYIIMLSGFLMTATYTISILIVFKQLFWFKKRTT